MNFDKINEEKIAKVEEVLYGGVMPAHNKEVLRAQLKREDKFWAKEAVREDSNNSPVEGYFNPKE